MLAQFLVCFCFHIFQRNNHGRVVLVSSRRMQRLQSQRPQQHERWHLCRLSTCASATGGTSTIAFTAQCSHFRQPSGLPRVFHRDCWRTQVLLRHGYAAMPRHEISLGEFTTGQVSTSASPRMTQLNLVAPPGFSFPTLCAWTAKDVERWTWQRCKSGQKRVKRLIFDIFDGFCELQSCFWFVMMVSGLINIKGSRITIICQETIRYLITPRCC